MKKSGGGGSILAASTKGFGGLSLRPMSFRAVADRVAIHMRTLREQNGLPRRAQGALLAKTGFTMAEILLSLTIIGVVAAITLPSLTGNINERVWNTQRKAFYARFSQAIALLPSLNGYGVGATDAETALNAAETFLTEGLSKVLKINNICDNEHLADCGLPDKITPYSGDVISPFPQDIYHLNSMFNGSYSASAITYSYTQINTQAAAFETQNGESVGVFYNPNCINDTGGANDVFTQPLMCVNMIYDLNGNKGPNAVGKDIGFISALYPTDSVVVAPNLAHLGLEYVTQDEAGPFCKAKNSDYRLPNMEELTAMFYNRKLLDSKESLVGGYWSSSASSSGSTRANVVVHFGIGIRYRGSLSTFFAHCVKR